MFGETLHATSLIITVKRYVSTGYYNHVSTFAGY